MFQRAFFLPILPDLMIWSNYFVLPGVLFLVCMFWDWVVQRHRPIVQQWEAKNEGSLLVPGEEIVRLMRDWLENVLITEPTMRKMIFQSKCLVRRGWNRCQTAKPEKPQELPPGKKRRQNMPYNGILNKTDFTKASGDFRKIMLQIISDGF